MHPDDRDNYSKKRKRNDHGGGRGQEDHSRKRLTTDELTLQRLRREIIEIGEPSRYKISATILHAGYGFATEIENSVIRKGLLDTFLAVVVEQPHKTPLISGILEVANSKSESAGKFAIEFFHSTLQESILKGNWNKVKLIVRLIACLSSIIEGKGTVTLLQTLLDKAIEVQQASESRIGFAEDLWINALLAIPYLILNLPDIEDIKTSASELLVKAESFPTRKSKALDLVQPFFGEKRPYDIKEVVQIILPALKRLESSEWKLTKMMDIRALIQPVLADKAPTKHTFPAIAIPETEEYSRTYNNENGLYKYPRIFYQNYLPVMYETVPPVDTYESLIMRDLATDIMINMDFNRKEVTRQLITLDLFFNNQVFAEPGISFDRLSTIPEGSSTWKIEDVAVEAILSLMFQLPEMRYKSVYYDSLLIEACIMAPQAIAPVFGRAIRFLYSNLESADVEVFHRILDWFSHHLSNFGFTWKWQEWVKDIELNEFHPRKVFMKQLIVKEVRLSYPQRVKDTLPDEFVSLLPDFQEEPIFKYLEAESLFQNEVHGLISCLREKKSSEEFYNTLNQISEKTELEPAQKEVTDVVVSSVCYLGNRSLSHANSWIGRAMEYLKSVCDDEVSMGYAVASVMEYWKEQQFIGVLILDQMLKQNVISALSIVNWLFEDEQRIIFTTNHGWEALLRTLTHVKESANELTIEADTTSENNSLDARDKIFGLVIDKLVAIQGIDLDEESNKWIEWWKRGGIKAIMRKFHDVFSQDGVVNSEDAYVLEILSQVKALGN
ncbi:hypothetical protein NADFUDRAFT_47202 [Nadsonia fulvescens var. elongata DSM 6958]|uniref:MIF4G domain-containing protein n=1 Tax=Nadsonia fulvescens var. elongata DSM 6958 TaxID=857566 RepID=A0A1E3PI47_9ASCO|nr:hypothetical protein NADFUDRAFT_47202 [Nadsonia fulvescens var. elongata DSM 6958]